MSSESLFDFSGVAAAAPAGRLAALDADFEATGGDHERWEAYVLDPAGDPVLRGYVAFQLLHHPTLAVRAPENRDQMLVDPSMRFGRFEAVFLDLLHAALTLRQRDARAALERLLAKYRTSARLWVRYFRHEATLHSDSRSMTALSICEALEELKRLDPDEMDRIAGAQILFISAAFVVNNRPLLLYLDANRILPDVVWIAVINNMRAPTTHAEAETMRAALGWLRTSARRGGAVDLIAEIDEHLRELSEYH